MKKYHIFASKNKFIQIDDTCIFCNKNAERLFKQIDFFIRFDYPADSLEKQLLFFAEHSPCEFGISEIEFLIKNIVE